VRGEKLSLLKHSSLLDELVNPDLYTTLDGLVDLEDPTYQPQYLFSSVYNLLCRTHLSFLFRKLQRNHLDVLRGELQYRLTLQHGILGPSQDDRLQNRLGTLACVFRVLVSDFGRV
jgi:hypothetical protein